MATYKEEEFYGVPDFKETLTIVKRAYGELKNNHPSLKGKKLRDSFLNILERIYEKYIPFDSFKYSYSSFRDFKSKISRALKKKGKKKLSLQKEGGIEPPDDFEEIFQRCAWSRHFENKNQLNLLGREEW